MSELNEKIRQQLMEWAEPDFGTFSAGLIPGEKHVLGVRLPLLRSYAKELAKGDWQTYLLQASDDSMEETMLIPASLSSLNSSVIHARQPGYRSGSMASGIYNKGFAWSMISLKRWYARAAWGPSPPPLRKSFMLALPSLFL